MSTEEFEQRISFNLLYDFYSPLLTERQRKIYEAVCFSDLSLTEAAEKLGISRQAVSRIRQRVENKLKLLEKNLCFARSIKRLENRINELEAEILKLKSKGGY